MTHILIAEDETRISAFIEKGLRSHGFTTSVAKNANAALQLTQYGECRSIAIRSRTTWQRWA
jgi:DNA-binding response OmpR family regulator